MICPAQARKYSLPFASLNNLDIKHEKFSAAAHSTLVLFRGRKDFAGIENSTPPNAVDRYKRGELRLRYHLWCDAPKSTKET